MPDYPAARKGDNVAHIKGGGAILDGSPNVRVNGLPAARQGDPVQHNNRTETITQGSSSVLINGKPAARLTDKVGCGGSIAAGSANVFIGNGPTGRACSTCPGGIAVGSPVNPLLGAKVLGGPEDLDFALPGALPVVWQRHYSSYVGPAGHAPGLLGTGWRLPFELHLILSDDKTDLFDTKNRTIAFHALPPGAQHYSQSEGFWLMRGGAHEALNPDPAQQTQAQQAAWQNDPLWRHIPEAWRQDPHYVMAASGDRSVWLFAAADVTVVPGVTPWLLTAMVDVLGRQQRYQRHIKTDERKSQFKNQLHTIVDGTGRRFALDYATVRRSHTDDSGLRLSGVRLQGESGNASEDTVLVSYGYANAGDLASVTDRHGRTVRQFGYDHHHRMSSHSVMGGPVASYVYESELPGAKVTHQRNAGGLDYRFDYQSDRTVVTDSLGRTQTFQFDGEGASRRLVRYFDATGAYTDYQHNMTGALVSETNALGHVTRYDRDMQGRLTGSTAPDGSQTHSHWDDTTGQLHSVTAPDGAVSRFDHDAWARLLQTTAPDGSVTAYRYLDPHSSVAARLTAEHPRQIVDAKGGIKHLTWTVLGQLASYTDCSGQTTRYRYDDAHRLIGAHYPDGDDQTWRFDAAGNRLPSPVPNGTPQFNNKWIDAWKDNRVQFDATQTLTHDAWGNVIQIDSADGSKLSLRYDALHRIKASQLIQPTQDAHGQPYQYVITTHYQYDALSRRFGKHVVEGYLGQPDENDWLHTTWYGWDGDRLTTTQTEEEAEEGEGNADGRVIGNTVTTVYEPNSFVPLLRIETKADKQADGNALTQAAQEAGTPKDQIARMQEVVAMALEGGAEGMTAISPSVQHALDSGNLNAADVVREAQALAKKKPEKHSQSVLFFHCDHLGTPVALYDRKGSVVWNSELDPWGNTRREYNPLKIEQPIRMQGQQFDRETGLHYNRYRYFDPTLGRYVTQDPIGLAGGFNLNVYANENPLKKVDPFGLDTFDSMADRAAGIPSGSGIENIKAGIENFKNSPRADGNPLGWGCGDSKTDNFVPDKPFGSNFMPSCRAHDICYGDKKGPLKEKCDDDFYKNMLKECAAKSWPMKQVCEATAHDYHAAVQFMGKDAFSNARK